MARVVFVLEKGRNSGNCGHDLINRTQDCSVVVPRRVYNEYVGRLYELQEDVRRKEGRWEMIRTEASLNAPKVEGGVKNIRYCPALALIG